MPKLSEKGSKGISDLIHESVAYVRAGFPEDVGETLPKLSEKGKKVLSDLIHEAETNTQLRGIFNGALKMGVSKRELYQIYPLYNPANVLSKGLSTLFGPKVGAISAEASEGLVRGFLWDVGDEKDKTTARQIGQAIGASASFLSAASALRALMRMLPKFVGRKLITSGPKLLRGKPVSGKELKRVVSEAKAPISETIAPAPKLIGTGQKSIGTGQKLQKTKLLAPTPKRIPEKGVLSKLQKDLDDAAFRLSQHEKKLFKAAKLRKLKDAKATAKRKARDQKAFEAAQKKELKHLPGQVHMRKWRN